MKLKSQPQPPIPSGHYTFYFQYFNFFPICSDIKESWINNLLSAVRTEKRKRKKLERIKCLLDIQTQGKYYRVYTYPGHLGATSP